MQIRPVGAQLLHTDGQTEGRKLMVAFRNFANAPKNCPLYDFFFPDLVPSCLCSVTLSVLK